jgi:hypothetical protein
VAAHEHVVSELIAEGRDALKSGDAAQARQAFEQALAGATAPGHALEGLARAEYPDGSFRLAIERWEQAYAAHRAAGEHVGAVRSARNLGYMHGAVMGDRAVMSGWLARAQTLLGDAPDSLEAGWVALSVGMFAGDRRLRESHLRDALGLARRHGDADLELLALAYLGASLVHDDRLDEGMALLDEALAAVEGNEVDDFFVFGDVFFRDAERCAAALHEVLSGGRAFEDAMAELHRSRDAEVLPIYELTNALATPAPPPPELQQLLGSLPGDQAAMDDFASVVAGTLSPVDFLARAMALAAS